MSIWLPLRKNPVYRKLRERLRDRHDLAAHRRSHPRLPDGSRGSDELDRLERELEGPWSDYTETVSIANAAVSLELASLLAFLTDGLGPDDGPVWDLGSGFSSWVLRRPGTEPRPQVVSCDDHQDWLGKTREYLASKGVEPGDDLRLWRGAAETLGSATAAPSVVLHDLGVPETRARELPALLDLAGPDTLFVLDDVHKPVIRQAALDEIERRDLAVETLLPWTWDRWGRRAWLIHGFRGSR
jgi:hypothetical protein